MSILSIVTIGQTPRTDITPELAELLPNVSLIEHGALDLLGPDQIKALAPARDATGILTSRLRDGGFAVFTHADADPLVEAAVARGEGQGADATLVVCSSHFPQMSHRQPLFFMEPLAHAAVRGLLTGFRQARLGVLCPLPDQEAGARKRWAETTGCAPAATASASPYAAGMDTIAAAISQLTESSDLVVLDCAGYSSAMVEAGRALAQRDVPVLTVRALAAHTLAALLA